MSKSDKLSARWTRLMNRVAARRATLTRAATAFVSQPEPRTIGSYARGRQLVAGNFLFAGHLVQEPGSNIWDLTWPDNDFAEEIHGFGWLDDLAALGDANAKGISGKGVTPYLLSRIMELTGGRSLETNIALIVNNARLAGQIAVELAEAKS